MVPSMGDIVGFSCYSQFKLFTILYLKILGMLGDEALLLCVGVLLAHACLIPAESRRGSQIPQTWSYRLL